MSIVRSTILAFGFLALSVAGTVASPAEPTGPAYTAEQLLSFDLSGLKIGMTANEAEAVLRSAGYEGAFEKTISDRVSGWIRVDQAVYPFRYVAKDGQTRLWAVHFQQKFDVNMSEGSIKDKIVAKYGRPTRVEDAMMFYESPWPFNISDAKYCLAMDYSGCRMNMVRDNPYKSFSEFEAAYKFADARPQLRIEVRSTEIMARLENREAKNAANDLLQEKAKLAEDEKRRKATKSLDLGL